VPCLKAVHKVARAEVAGSASHDAGARGAGLQAGARMVKKERRMTWSERGKSNLRLQPDNPKICPNEAA
jgi:hypothetical protein